MEDENKIQDLEIDALTKLFTFYANKFYWFSEDPEIRRFHLDDEFLEPYRLLGRAIEGIVEQLGDHDIIQMLDLFTELDQSYEGFYGCREAL